jgi:hypothetical protein
MAGAVAMIPHRPIPLLPYEKQLADALGVSEEVYRRFQLEVASRVRIDPAAPKADVATTMFVINLVVGVGFSLLGALFRPKQSKPPTLENRQTGGENRTENRRYAPRYGFGSSQEVANSGQRYPLVIAKREALSDGITYGGVRVNLLLLWSQMWSYRGSQLFRGIYALGRRDMGSISVEGFAFGDNSLTNYGIGAANSSASRFTLYYSANGGRIKGTDNIAGRSAAKDPANAENFGGADVFRYTGLNGGIDADFCSVAKPSANTALGLYGICPNGLAYRVMPRLRPTANYQIYTRNNGTQYYLEGEDDTASLADFWKSKYSWSCRSGLTSYIRGGNTTTPATGENYVLVDVGVDDILVYVISSNSDANTQISMTAANTDVNVDAKSDTIVKQLDVASSVAGWQHSADDNLIDGELYKIGSALAVMENRVTNGTDRWFTSESDNEPPGGGVSMEYRFRVVRAGKAGFVGGQIISPATTGTTIVPPRYDRATNMALLVVANRYKTASQFPQIFRCALASFGVTRSTRLIEIGFKSTVGIKANSATSFRSCPTLQEVNNKAGQNRIGVVADGAKLNPSLFNSNTATSTQVRFSGCKLLFREDSGAWITFADGIFLFRSGTSEPLYNYLRVQFGYHSPNWQVQLEPLSSWEVAANINWGGDVLVIDPIQPAASRTNPGQGVTVSFNGYHLQPAQFAAAFAMDSLDAAVDIGYGWTTGTTMLDPYARLAEKFCYDEIVTTADGGPEHEVSYVNIFTTNTELAEYDDLACIGLNILAGNEATQLAQGSQSVTNGYEMRRLLNGLTKGATHLFPDLLLELLTSKELGDGAFITDAQIDLDSFEFCADICYNRRYFFDAVMPELINLLEWSAEVGGTHLLKLVKRGSKFGLQPMVVFGVPLSISGLFTAGNIADGTFELELIPYENRQPISVIVKYREQSPAISGYQPGLFPVEKTVFVKEAARPDTDPIETLDLSDYCTSPRHAIDAACALIRMRRLVDHTIRFSTTPEGLTASLASGDYIQVAYDLIYFDSYAHGVITNGGVLVVTRPDLMTTGTHACLTWDGSENVPIQQNVIVAADGTATPTGIFFARKNTGSQLRTYEVVKINIDQAGVIQIEANYSPTDDAGFSLLTKDWCTYSSNINWSVRY